MVMMVVMFAVTSQGRGNGHKGQKSCAQEELEYVHICHDA